MEQVIQIKKVLKDMKRIGRNKYNVMYEGILRIRLFLKSISSFFCKLYTCKVISES